MEKKFSRASNFSAREDNILINLVNLYKHQVECKKSDTNTNKIKAEAWSKIEELNSVSGEPYKPSDVEEQIRKHKKTYQTKICRPKQIYNWNRWWIIERYNNYRN